MMYFYKECSSDCLSGSCDQVTGDCNCIDGFYGDDCTEGKTISIINSSNFVDL